MLQQLIPGHFAFLQACHAAQHATKRCLHARGNLVVAVARSDAFNERPLLVAIGEGQVVAKGPVGGKLSHARTSARRGCCRIFPLPRLLAGNLDRSRVRNRRRTLRPKQAQAGIEQAVRSKLRGRKREAHIAGIREDHFVVIPAIAVMRENIAASLRRGFHGMRIQHPVAEVDDVDVLLDEDVSGECAVPEPVTQPILILRCAGAVLFRRCGRVVDAGSDSNFTQRASLDLLRNSRYGRRIAALKTHIDTLRAHDLLCNFECMSGLANVDAHGLFTVNMLARGYCGFKVLHVKKRRRRNLDQVDIGRRRELLEGMRSVEEKLAVERRLSEPRLHLVEVRAPGGKVIGKQIGEGHNLRGCILRERSGDRGAAISAAQQSVAHGGVGRVPESSERFQQCHAGSHCRSGLEKFATIHGGPSLCFQTKASNRHTVYASTSPRIFSRYSFSFFTSSICCGPLVSRSIVTAPV